MGGRLEAKIMKSKAKFATAVLLVLMVAGCGKKEQAAETLAAEESGTAAAPAAKAGAAPAPGKEVLPGASSVRSAIEKKDYETAVGGLLALRGAARQSPQTEEYTTLYDEVKLALIDASQTDPKAASALMTLRAAAAGR